MTAIIGILNRAAVAIAGDSATTVGNSEKSKIYNNANKIFQLTQNNPVGIAIYGNADLFGIPWETIIKMYKAQFKSVAFDELHEYASDFLKFLSENIIKFVAPGEQEKLIRLISNRIINEIKIKIDENIALAIEEGQDDDEDPITPELSLDFAIDHFTTIIEGFKVIPSFSEYRPEAFRNDYAQVVGDEVAQIIADIPITPEQISKIESLVYLISCREFFYELNTGIVISGFGQENIFPRLVSYEIGGIVNNTIRYKYGRESTITNESSTDITAFGQTDSIWGFLNGINPQMQLQINELMDLTLQDFSQIVLDKLTSANLNQEDEEGTQKLPLISPAQALALKAAFDEAATNLANNLQQEVNKVKLHGNHFPILDTLMYLSKEDMAEMAESLINLSYLQRRVSFADESVGGPIDVVLITKGDGFIWIKRKHYFKPESNLNYLANVLKTQDQRIK